tara:strand:- start:635 stop:829 length:195 start_codon:yes stop_codon:yes gene_type:complete
MEELVDLIATDKSASDISDKIKDILYTKAAEKVDNSKPLVASSMFGDTSNDTDESEQQSSEDQE